MRGITVAVKITGDVDVFDDRDKSNLDGRLLGAARTGDVRLAAKMLDEGADINAVGEEGYTPLHEAVRANRKEAAALLVERGASLAAKEQTGLTPFELAREYERHAVITSMRHALSLRNAARLMAVRRRTPKPARP